MFLTRALLGAFLICLSISQVNAGYSSYRAGDPITKNFACASAVAVEYMYKNDPSSDQGREYMAMGVCKAFPTGIGLTLKGRVRNIHKTEFWAGHAASGDGSLWTAVDANNFQVFVIISNQGGPHPEEQSSLPGVQLVGNTPVCGKRSALVGKLNGKYSETTDAIGLVANGSVLELLVSEGGSWSMIMTNPQGVTCLVMAGESWQKITPTLKKENSF